MRLKLAGSAIGVEDYCRFYISIPAQGVSSHFYGRKSTDCPAILGANLPTHKFELTPCAGMLM